MSMSDWAKREVAIACEREKEKAIDDYDWSDYGCGCYNSALKAYLSLCEDGHSGMSFGFTRAILIRLLNQRPLTPIEDTEDVWNECRTKSEDGTVSYQCKRLSSLFKDVHPDGTVSYTDVEGYYAEDKETGCTYSSGLIRRVVEEMFPITMPYYPSTKPIRVVAGECLTDEVNGDFDTVAIYYAVKDEEQIPINRFFKADEEDAEWVEITEADWQKRYANKIR